MKQTWCFFSLQWTISLSGAYSYIALIKHVWDCPKEWIQLDEDSFLNLPEHKAGEPDPDSPAYFVNARFLDLWFIMIFWFVLICYVFICFPVLQSWHYFNIFIALRKARCWHHVHLQPSEPCLQGKIFSLWYVSWLCSTSSQMRSLFLSEWPRYKNWIAAALFDGESAVVFCLATQPRHALCNHLQANYCCPVDKLLAAALAEWDDYEKSFRWRWRQFLFSLWFCASEYNRATRWRT